MNSDIICINETKINFEKFHKTPINIENYNGYWNFCKVSAGYSGVGVFSKYKPIRVIEDLPSALNSQ